jgi:hypothetical protein
LIDTCCATFTDIFEGFPAGAFHVPSAGELYLDALYPTLSLNRG